MTEPAADLSYASYFSHPVQRAVVRAVEKATGQPKIKELYDHYREHLANDVPFFEAAIRLLELDVQFNSARHAGIPKTGPLVVVANHPFGVLDGLMICWLVSLVREDFKILTNSVLEAAPEARPWLLPIDFADTKEALAINLETRKASLEILGSGGCIIVFPAGGISTAPRAFAAAIDDDWKPFTAKLITKSNAAVTPIFFEGQNSRLFQWASHVSMSLRLSLVFREVRRRMGQKMPVHIGKTLQPDDLSAAGKRAALMQYLREATYDLAPPDWRTRFRRAEEKVKSKEAA
ncbi:MAG: lysophospholipid acyltransferase family protein [Pseudomonadota bacterium]